MRALAVVVAIVAGIAWFLAATILPEFSQAVMASAAPNPQFGMGLRARLLQNDILNYALIGLVATIGAALLWRAGRPAPPAPVPSAADWRPGPRPSAGAPRHCTNCAASIAAGTRFCGQCGAPVPSAESIPAATDPQAVRRLCPSCDKLAIVADATCTNCGWDYLAKRGPHGGRGEARTAEAMKTCERCEKEVELWRLNCPHCGSQFAQVRPPGPIMRDRG